jgi:hypothetical protein
MGFDRDPAREVQKEYGKCAKINRCDESLSTRDHSVIFAKYVPAPVVFTGKFALPQWTRMVRGVHCGQRLVTAGSDPRTRDNGAGEVER